MLLEGVQLSLLQQPADRARRLVRDPVDPSLNPRPSSTRHSQRAVPIDTFAVPLTARSMPRPSSTRHSQRAVPIDTSAVPLTARSMPRPSSTRHSQLAMRTDIDASRFSSPSTTVRSTNAARPRASRRFGATT